MRYAQINTQSLPYQGTWPTTPVQIDLARILADELRSMGIEDVFLDEKTCVVYAHLPASPGHESNAPVGFIAHMDTAPDVSGDHVRPWLLKHYDGGDIVLNAEKQIVMRVSDYPNLLRYIGQDLVLTDGTTLLGGDDKASIAAIMTMAEYFCTYPEEIHGPLSLADRGLRFSDRKAFPCTDPRDHSCGNLPQYCTLKTATPERKPKTQSI